MFYNIPTTSVMSRKKFNQQYYRYNQHYQHNFLNSNKEVKNNITIKNHKPDFDKASAKDMQKQQDISKVEEKHKLDVVPSTSPNKSEALILLASDSPPSSTSSSQHNCVGENKDINLDCSSCWTNLVTPQCTDTKSLQFWPWVHISRAESSSMSSESPCNSSISASINSNAEKNNIPNFNRGSNADNISTTTDNPNSKLSLFTESGRKSKFVEDHTGMTTALEPNTVNTASATTRVVDSTITTTTNCATDKEMTSKSKSNATLAHHPLLAAKEFPNSSSISTKASKDSNDNATKTFIITSPANSPTPSTSGSPPSNSY
ncbi:unnamed protein product [Ceratitis capitata]|uniref:(Mediterranean fruit fly) hypothetical protein n=1 Tax=Ceratitis capitata TaxID=7213 RepID=A0A811UQZ4_CERCA|nr:unnamed protein product [Ceratitis capitata]